MTARAAMLIAFTIWGLAARVQTTTMFDGTQLTTNYAVGQISVFGSFVALGSGKSWEDAFAAAQVKYPAIELPILTKPVMNDQPRVCIIQLLDAKGRVIEKLETEAIDEADANAIAQRWAKLGGISFASTTVTFK